MAEVMVNTYAIAEVVVKTYVMAKKSDDHPPRLRPGRTDCRNRVEAALHACRPTQGTYPQRWTIL